MKVRQLKKKEMIETGIVQAWNEDVSTGVPTWQVWYKGVLFAELEELKEAYDRLTKLIALDSTK